tara:strand:+ start:227 stop:613 length:387 start_codon:yes stop_codon:yes gene_type:complete
MRQRLRNIPNPHLFARNTVRLIQPNDEDQRARLRSILEGAMPRFKALDANHRAAMGSLIDSVYEELKPHVDAEQWARIEDRDRRFREMMRRWGPRRPPRDMRDLRNEGRSLDSLRDGRKRDRLPPENQ